MLRMTMLAVGLATAFVLTLSYAIDGEKLVRAKANTEQTSDGGEKSILIAQPADVVLSVHQPQLNEITSWVVQWVFIDQVKEENPTIVPTIVHSCFKWLSRAFIISPNAP